MIIHLIFFVFLPYHCKNFFEENSHASFGKTDPIIAFRVKV